MFPIKDTVPASRLPVVTWAIIALNAAVFYFQTGLSPEEMEALVFRSGLVPARVGADPASFSTFITSMFLHGNSWHFLANMWMLYLFGDNVEDRLGPGRFITFYLLCGIAAGLVHFLSDPASTVPAIGASGAISGVLGAYLVLYPTAEVITLILVIIIPLFVRIPAVVFLGVWFFIQLIGGTAALLDVSAGGIAWWAHIGGFLAGIALLPLLGAAGDYRPPYPDERGPW